MAPPDDPVRPGRGHAPPGCADPVQGDEVPLHPRGPLGGGARHDGQQRAAAAFEEVGEAPPGAPRKAGNRPGRVAQTKIGHHHTGRPGCGARRGAGRPPNRPGRRRGLPETRTPRSAANRPPARRRAPDRSGRRRTASWLHGGRAAPAPPDRLGTGQRGISRNGRPPITCAIRRSRVRLWTWLEGGDGGAQHARDRCAGEQRLARGAPTFAATGAGWPSVSGRGASLGRAGGRGSIPVSRYSAGGPGGAGATAEPTPALWVPEPDAAVGDAASGGPRRPWACPPSPGTDPRDQGSAPGRASARRWRCPGRQRQGEIAQPDLTTPRRALAHPRSSP